MEIATKIAPLCIAIIMFGLGLGLTTSNFLRVMEKKGFIRRNIKLEYTLGHVKNLKVFQQNYLINQKNLSDFCTTLFNLMKNSKFKID